jgi:hypothetical protein
MRTTSLEVMQFVFNHTTFDPKDKMDQAVMAALKPLGVEPGKAYDPKKVAKIDGKKLAEAAKRIQKEAMTTFSKPGGQILTCMTCFKPKGKMKLDPMYMQSAVGPVGLPAHQAVYPPVPTADGKPMNAQHDYVIRMTKDQMPPAKAFWSVTLYDLKNGFFIPNDRKKYSVGENAGMKLNKEGGIAIYIAAEKPKDAPEENWLPITRKDEAIDMVMRIYAPDLKKMKTQLHAQEVLPFPEPSSASTTGKTLADSKHQWRKAENHLPKDAPNIVIFMTDDAGFPIRVFGGPVHMPTMDRLAETGISYNAFHTTAMCSPTRASLLTGRNHHRVVPARLPSLLRTGTVMWARYQSQRPRLPRCFPTMVTIPPHLASGTIHR